MKKEVNQCKKRKVLDPLVESVQTQEHTKKEKGLIRDNNVIIKEARQNAKEKIEQTIDKIDQKQDVITHAQTKTQIDIMLEETVLIQVEKITIRTTEDQSQEMVDQKKEMIV